MCIRGLKPLAVCRQRAPRLPPPGVYPACKGRRCTWRRRRRRWRRRGRRGRQRRRWQRQRGPGRRGWGPRAHAQKRPGGRRLPRGPSCGRCMWALCAVPAARWATEGGWYLACYSDTACCRRCRAASTPLDCPTPRAAPNNVGSVQQRPVPHAPSGAAARRRCARCSTWRTAWRRCWAPAGRACWRRWTRWTASCTPRAPPRRRAAVGPCVGSCAGRRRPLALRADHPGPSCQPPDGTAQLRRCRSCAC